MAFDVRARAAWHPLPLGGARFSNEQSTFSLALFWLRLLRINRLASSFVKRRLLDFGALVMAHSGAGAAARSQPLALIGAAPREREREAASSSSLEQAHSKSMNWRPIKPAQGPVGGRPLRNGRNWRAFCKPRIGGSCSGLNWPFEPLDANKTGAKQAKERANGAHIKPARVHLASC